MMAWAPKVAGSAVLPRLPVPVISVTAVGDLPAPWFDGLARLSAPECQQPVEPGTTTGEKSNEYTLPPWHSRGCALERSWLVGKACVLGPDELRGARTCATVSLGRPARLSKPCFCTDLGGRQSKWSLLDEIRQLTAKPGAQAWGIAEITAGVVIWEDGSHLEPWQSSLPDDRAEGTRPSG